MGGAFLVLNKAITSNKSEALVFTKNCCMLRVSYHAWRLRKNPNVECAQSRHGIAAGRKEAKEIILVQARLPSTPFLSKGKKG